MATSSGETSPASSAGSSPATSPKAGFLSSVFSMSSKRKPGTLSKSQPVLPSSHREKDEDSVLELRSRNGQTVLHKLSREDRRKLGSMTPDARSVYLSRLANERVQSVSLDKDPEAIMRKRKEEKNRLSLSVSSVQEKIDLTVASRRSVQETQDVARKRSAMGIKMERKLARSGGARTPLVSSSTSSTSSSASHGFRGVPHSPGEFSSSEEEGESPASMRLQRSASIFWMHPSQMAGAMLSTTLPDLSHFLEDGRSPPEPDSPRTLRRVSSASELRAGSKRIRRTGSWENMQRLLRELAGDTETTVTDKGVDSDEEGAELTSEVVIDNGRDDVRFVCVSDTHAHHGGVKVPDGDVLLHAGDFSYTGSMKEMEAFCQWLDSLPHRVKIVIAGNHDVTMQAEFYATQYARWHKEKEDDEAIRTMLKKHCIYLEDQSVWVNGIHIYGSPWQPWFLNWAFNLQRGAALKSKWDMIPEGVDVLLTHGPPYGHGDGMVNKRCPSRPQHVGDEDLRRAVERIRPKYHIFGHVHEGVGVSRTKDTTFANCSTCDSAYRPWNPPFKFTLKKVT